MKSVFLMQKISAKFLVLFFIIGCAFSYNQANAEVVNNLYKSSILVPSSSETARKEAATKSMAQILVRASGKIEILSASKTSQYLDKAINYISEFRYEHTKNKLRLDDGREVWAQNLYLTFDKAAINSILADLGYGVWDTNRPKTMFWILIKEGSKSYLLNSNTNSSLASTITNNAWARGLPAYLPKLDWQDAKYVSATSIWNMDLNSAINASKTYNANAVVIARIYQQQDQWQSDWLLSSGGKTSKFSYENQNLSYLMRLGSYKSVEVLADQYAINMQKNSYSSSQLNINVQGVNNLSDYAYLTQYLEKNPAVASVGLISLDSGKLSLSLKLRVSEQQFLSNMKLDKKLQARSDGWFVWR